jgi:hypothetical protein
MCIDYRKRGENSVSVVLMPNVCGQRLVVLSVNDNTDGWAVRDFITNKILEDEASGRTRAQMEAEVLPVPPGHSEYPPFYNVTDVLHFQTWELYLILRSNAFHRRNDDWYDTTTPVNAAFGRWDDLDKRPGWTPIHL